MRMFRCLMFHFSVAWSSGVPELVKCLQDRGTAVFLVSGGFHAIIDPIALHLGIPPDHVFANTILFKVCKRGTGMHFRCWVQLVRCPGALHIATAKQLTFCCLFWPAHLYLKAHRGCRKLSM